MLRTNLIPPEQKERLKWKNYYQNIISSGFILFLLILIFIISLAGILLFIHFKYLSIENKITIEQSRIIQTESYKDLEKKIINLNKNLADFRKTQNQKSNIYSLLDNIFQFTCRGYCLQSGGKQGLQIDYNNRIFFHSGNFIGHKK